MITQDVKNALYKCATRHIDLNTYGDITPNIPYHKQDVEHIAYWFKVDVNELDQYWRDV